MRLLFLNHLQNAQQSLRASKIRSMLTMLGVTIGIASITAILALNGGANKIISNQISDLGGNIIIVRPGVITDPISNFMRGQLQRDYFAGTLTENDILKIQQIEHVESLAPIMVLSGTIKGDKVAPDSSITVATTPSFMNISNYSIYEGQFLENNIDINTAVIGKKLSENIFASKSSLGRTFTIRDQQFTVVGVIDEVNKPINFNSVDIDNTAFINLTMGRQLNQSVVQIQQINIKVDSVANFDQVISNINKTLKSAHGGENDFSVLTDDQISQPTNLFFYAIAGFTTAIATISLIVGGIGIMNIMLVTVAERTREIGIRKALGASNSDILWQFLIESLMISIIGGAAGFVIGYAIAFGLTSMLTFKPIISWDIVGFAVAVSIIMGVVFGMYPAMRASRKDPIESLHEFN
jgi:putative ABC transport system permease protein